VTPRSRMAPGTLDVSIRSFSYGERTVLKDVSFSVPAGELLSVLGPNGSGKSTLFRILTGAVRLDDGALSYGGKDMTSLPPAARSQIFSMMGQMRDSYLPYSAIEVVLMGRAMAAGSGFFENRDGIERARAALARVGADRLERRRIDRLSAGERQRVFLARCLYQDTPVILLDEPTNFLDVKAQADLEEVIEELHLSDGKTIILITHDLNQALRLADRAMLLREGTVEGLGVPSEVLTPARIFQAYGARMRMVKLQPDGEDYLVAERNGAAPARISDRPSGGQISSRRS
jgi:iron complex transport system ATP-binding protein